VTLRHDERLKDAQEVYLQFALLYSTTSGQRRIRRAVQTQACRLIARMRMRLFHAATSATYGFTATKTGLQLLRKRHADRRA